MKKLSLIAFLLAFIMCACALAGCSAKTQEAGAPDGMKLASSADADYCMYVPDEEGFWRIDRSGLYSSASYSSGDATSISTTVYSVVQGGNVTVESWWEEFVPDIKEIYTEMSDVAVKDAKIDGIKGKEYSFSGKLAGNEYKYIITAVIKDAYVYYITYTSTPEFYDEHLDDLESVINNFTFK